jgi:hypothetical protein
MEDPHEFPHEFLIELAASHPIQTDEDYLELEDYFAEAGDSQ